MRLECLIYGLLAAFAVPGHSAEEEGTWSPISGRVAGEEIEEKGGVRWQKNGGGETGGGTKWRDKIEKVEGQNSVFKIRVQG